MATLPKDIAAMMGPPRTPMPPALAVLPVASAYYGAIPTIYRDVQFRSRLEARWAVFFDLLKWPWIYEPVDLKGYIPDFILTFKTPLLVEVKPALSLDELRLALPKIEQSGWNNEALVVGARLFPAHETQGMQVGPVLGLLADKGYAPDHWDWESAFTFYCTNCGRLSFAHALGSYHCRVSDCYDGDHYLGPCEDADWNALWVQAQNQTQWKAKEVNGK